MDRGTKESLNDLLVRVREGDEGSVDELYGIMAPTVRYIALKYLRSESDADDLVQDFGLDIHKYAQTFYLNNNAYSYLCKIATRQSINRYKKLHHRREVEVGYVDYSDIECRDDDAEAIALRNDVSAAMRKLTETQRIIIQETVFEDLTVRQVAKTVGKSKTQVARLKNSAIEILKRELESIRRDKQDG